MTYSLASDTTTVTLINPMSINKVKSREIKNYTSADDTYILRDSGKDIEQITITGREVGTSNSTPTTDYETYSDTSISGDLWKDHWRAQKVTIGTTGTSECFYATDIRLWAKRLNTVSNVTVSLRSDVDSTDLTTGTKAGAAFPTAAEAWVSIALDSAVELYSGSTYFIVFRNDGADGNNYIKLGMNNSPGYAGGRLYQSADGGSTWTEQPNNDMNFYIDGYRSDGAYDLMRTLNWLVNSGDEITISGLSDSNLNTTYRIVSFNCTNPVGRVYTYDYNITLEKT